MIEDLDQSLTHISKQVRMMHDQVIVAVHTFDSFNERWTGIEEEIRADLKRTHDKIDALAAARDLAELSDSRERDTKKQTMIREIFLD